MKITKGDQMAFWNYDLNKIVRLDHPLRKIDEIISFKKIALRFNELLTSVGRKGYGVEVGIKSLFLQFYYDLSDRELEERLRYDIAFRWFCGFKIDEETPDHSYYGRTRKALQTERIGKIFRMINKKARDKKILRGVFTFVDATAIKTKETTWAERDKAIREGEEALNNQNVEKYSADKDARFGCNGKSKFWYGYKQHTSVDMGSGLIQKAAVTPANVSEGKGIKHICPTDSMIFGDKGYCGKRSQNTMRKRRCHSGVILKKNMRDKDRDKDRWLTKVRAPFEGVFSKKTKRARYRGLAKVQLQVFLESIVFNVRRLVVIDSPPLWFGA